MTAPPPMHTPTARHIAANGPLYPVSQPLENQTAELPSPPGGQFTSLTDPSRRMSLSQVKCAIPIAYFSPRRLSLEAAAQEGRHLLARVQLPMSL